MVSRILAVCAFCGLLAQAQNTDVSKMTPADAEKIEARLESFPDDVPARGQLVRYYSRTGMETAKPKQRKHIVWLIEHHPDAPVLSEAAAVVDKDGYAEVERAWGAQFNGGHTPAAVYLNALTFFKAANGAFARKLAADAIAQYPTDARIGILEGHLDAMAILGGVGLNNYGQITSFDEQLAKSEDVARARKELETTRNPQILGGAAMMFSGQTMAFLSRGRADGQKAALEQAERCYQRAIELDSQGERWNSGLRSVYLLMASATSNNAEKIPLLEKGAKLPGTDLDRSYLLTDLAQSYFNAGDMVKAGTTAKELLRIGDSNPSNWNFGNALHHGNITLGRIALKNGDVAEARTRLLAAGRTPGSPQLNSFGPNWNLAQELLAKGEREAVLTYIDLCRQFWKSGTPRLDTWAAALRSGGTPNFFGPGESPRSTLLGRAAPDFRLRELKGGQVSLADYKGKIVLLDFWATWCGPCRQEMPEFEKLHREFQGKDVAILAIDVGEPDDTVSEYITKEKYTFPVLLEKGTDTAKNYGVNAYPTLMALDKEGRIAEVVIGSGPESRIRQAIQTARAGAPPPSAAPPAAAPRAAPTAPAATIPPAVTAEDYYRDAYRFRGEKKFAEAIAALDHAIALRKDWADAWVARAQSHYQLKHYDATITDLTVAIRLDPDRWQAYDERGLAYSYSGRQPQAIPDYTRAIQLAPKVATAYNNRGWAYLQVDRLEEAKADLDRAIALNPTIHLALENRVRLAMKQHRYAEALADCDAVLRMNPGDPWAPGQRAEVLRLMNAGTAPAAAVTASAAAPRLISPAPGAVFDHYPRQTTLVWTAVPGATRYVVEHDYFSGDQWASEQRGTAVLEQTTEPVFVFNFVGAQAGRWRVWALDAEGREGPKSEWREFRFTR